LNQRSFYGVAAIAIASILVGGTVAAYYFAQYSGEKSTNAGLLQELNDGTSKYSQLASNFNILLTRYNQSISLLSRSIAVVNTSAPVYRDASRQLSTLWQTYLELRPSSISLLQNNVLINFENGTRVWHNNTRAQPGWNFYLETLVLENGNVVARWYPQFGSHLVSSIGGAPSTQTRFWFVWTFNKAGGWQQAPVGADQLMVTDGSTFAWTLCPVDQNFNPTCKP
jgi:hypothetical protein